MIYVSEHKLTCVQKIEEYKYSDRDTDWWTNIQEKLGSHGERETWKRKRESCSVLQVGGLRRPAVVWLSRPAAQCVKITPPLSRLHNVSSHVCSSVIYNPGWTIKRSIISGSCAESGPARPGAEHADVMLCKSQQQQHLLMINEYWGASLLNSEATFVIWNLISILWFKAATRNFLLMLILAPPVDKSCSDSDFLIFTCPACARFNFLQLYFCFKHCVVLQLRLTVPPSSLWEKTSLTEQSSESLWVFSSRKINAMFGRWRWALCEHSCTFLIITTDI